MNEIETLKDQIRTILAENPDARNSDKVLTIALWKKFYPDKVRFNPHGNRFVVLDDLFDLPHIPSIARIRAKIQNNQLLYVPTNWEVAKARRMQEEVWREAMGYRVDPGNQTRMDLSE